MLYQQLILHFDLINGLILKLSILIDELLIGRRFLYFLNLHCTINGDIFIKLWWIWVMEVKLDLAVGIEIFGIRGKEYLSDWEMLGWWVIGDDIGKMWSK
jgi:hypothetical protein